MQSCKLKFYVIWTSTRQTVTNSEYLQINQLTRKKYWQPSLKKFQIERCQVKIWILKCYNLPKRIE